MEPAAVTESIQCDDELPEPMDCEFLVLANQGNDVQEMCAFGSNFCEVQSGSSL